MKLLLTILLSCLTPLTFGTTNTLVLTWAQPPGYTSQLYTATNLAGSWTPFVLTTNAPPVCVAATQSVAYFYVTVAPTNVVNLSLAGCGDPTNDVPAGATYVDSTTGNFWENQTGGVSGWIELIEN